MKIRFRGGQLHGFDLEFVSVLFINGDIRVNGESYVNTGTTDGEYTIYEVVGRNAG